MNATPAYLVRLQLKESVADSGEYPFVIPVIRTLSIEFTAPVTFFVGENGTGKSTVIEAIAALCKLPVSGGGRNELAGNHGPDTSSALAQALRPSFRRRPPDAYFLRAEFQAHFASLLDAPESALSPQRQLALLAHMSALVATGKSQFIIATHSPILLTFPDAQILSFDGDALRTISLEDTSHFQITKGILQNPAVYWKHLQERADNQNEPLHAKPRRSKSRADERVDQASED